MVDESTNTMNLNSQCEDKIIKIEETLCGEFLPDELKTLIRSYTVTWNAHIHFQTKVLKQLLNGEPILRGFPQCYVHIYWRNGAHGKSFRILTLIDCQH